MIFVEQKIKGVWIINPTPFEDERGLFRRHFCNEEFLKNDIEINISQTSVSENKYKKTLRGFMSKLFQHELDHLNGKLMVQHHIVEGFLDENVNISPELFHELQEVFR